MTRLFLSVILGVFLTSSCMHKRSHGDHSHSGDGEAKGMGMAMGGMMANPESHEKMAKLHGDAAQCLRAGKARDICLDAFKRGHQDLCQQMGGQGCQEMSKDLKAN